MSSPNTTPVNIDKVIKTLANQPARRKGKNRDYPESNWSREVIINISVIAQKYEAGDLPEEEKVLYEFCQKVKKDFGSKRRGKYGRTFLQDWVIKTLYKEIIFLNNIETENQ